LPATRSEEVAVIEAVVWVACGVTIVACALRCRRRPAALRTGRWATGFLFVCAGAGINAFYVLRGDDYARFADTSYIPFVRHTWRSLVVPNHTLFIGFLIGFELAVGFLVVAGGSRTQLAYAATIAFHIALLSFGWGFYAWSVPMVAALATLLSAERIASPAAVALERPPVAGRHLRAA
jgi:hypothetical protein